MKKAITAILVFALMITLCSVSVSAAVVETQNGGSEAGNTLKIGKSEDVYNWNFENVSAGVYKIALYIELDEGALDYDGSRQLRLSPKTCGSRCWIDFRWTDEAKEAFNDSGLKKVLIIGVINVPESGAKVEVGFWQDADAFVGKLEKVVLATADTNLYDSNYYLMAEISYRGQVEGDGDHSNNSFGEDAGQKMLAPAGSWTVSSAGGGTTGGGTTGGGTTGGGTTGGGTTKNPKTGDASAVLAIVAAGAAAFGGLKLRKK